MLEFVLGYHMGARGQARAASLAKGMESIQHTSSASRIEQVNEKVENIGVILKAMWSLLEEQGYSAEDLMDRIEEIEKRIHEEMNDGVPDAKPCRECGAMVARGLPRCQHCGAEARDNEAHPLDI